MALAQSTTFAGVTVPNAYHRIDRLVIEHKQSIFAYVRCYADASHAAAKDPLPTDKSFSFPWPVDAAGVPVSVADATAFAYVALCKMPEYSTATSV